MGRNGFSGGILFNSTLIIAVLSLCFLFFGAVNNLMPAAGAAAGTGAEKMNAGLITGRYSFLRSDENLGKLEIHELFPTKDDIPLINYAINGKKEEKNCGLLGCPECLFKTCFTGAIQLVETGTGRVFMVYYDKKLKALKKRGLCYMTIDEDKLMRHAEIYDIVFEQPSSHYGWKTKDGGGLKIYSWREISAPPAECMSAGILMKWQAVPSQRGTALKEVEERELEKAGQASPAFVPKKSAESEVSESKVSEIESLTVEELIKNEG